MTEGSPLLLMLQFAVPMLIGNIFQQLYNMVDSIIVGKYVGPNALAAVGVTGSITFFVFSLVIGLSTGIAVVISQYFGARDEDSLRLAFSTSVYVAAASALVLSIVGYLIARPVLILLRTPDNILEDAVLYLHIIMAGSTAMVIYNWIASVLRALGDSITPLIFLVISSLLNIGLDLLFVIQFEWGVAGVAYATILAQLVSGIICLLYAMIKMPILRLRRGEINYDAKMCTNVVKIGIPSGVQSSLIAVSVMVMQSVVNQYGSVIVAGFIAATKIESIVFQPGNSIGMANATYTGQNIGAGNIDRVKQGYRAMVLLNIISYIIITPFLWFFAGDLMKLFVDQSADAALVVETGTKYLHIVTPFFIPVAILMGFQSLLKSAGDVMATMILGLTEVLARVVFSFGLSHFFGYAGVFSATPAAWVTSCVIAFFFYYSYRWVRKGLVSKTT